MGGQQLTEMRLEALNRQISYVAQEDYLFPTSLLENIRIGRPDATDAEVLEAAEKAQCTEFFAQLPQGIHSMAGEAGKQLSGGQRQRIALAQAARHSKRRSDLRAGTWTADRHWHPCGAFGKLWSVPEIMAGSTGQC